MATPDDGWQRNVIALTVSRDMAIDFGLVEPTPEEAAEREESLRSYRERYAVQWKVYEAACEALDALDDPLARAILDLHVRQIEPGRFGGPECGGCNERPSTWPCDTVEIVAGHFDIEMPSMHISTPPEPPR